MRCWVTLAKKKCENQHGSCSVLGCVDIDMTRYLFFLFGFVYVFFSEPTVEAQASKGFLGLSRNMTLLIGGVGGAFLIILIGIIGVICFVRKLHKRQTPASTPANSRPTSQQDQPELSSVSVTKRRYTLSFSNYCLRHSGWDIILQDIDLYTVHGSRRYYTSKRNPFISPIQFCQR